MRSEGIRQGPTSVGGMSRRALSSVGIINEVVLVNRRSCPWVAPGTGESNRSFGHYRCKPFATSKDGLVAAVSVVVARRAKLAELKDHVPVEG
jgi:hypothetical protein